MLPSTKERVPKHSNQKHNVKIVSDAKARIKRYQNASAEEIDERLSELDQEWDIERMLEANAASIVILGAGLGATVNRKFFAVPLIVGGFLLQHALQGWCPPVPIFRRLGFRTSYEIDEERYALKAIRGDFKKNSKQSSADKAFKAASS